MFLFTLTFTFLLFLFRLNCWYELFHNFYYHTSCCCCWTLKYRRLWKNDVFFFNLRLSFTFMGSIKQRWPWNSLIRSVFVVCEEWMVQESFETATLSQLKLGKLIDSQLAISPFITVKTNINFKLVLPKTEKPRSTNTKPSNLFSSPTFIATYQISHAI